MGFFLHRSRTNGFPLSTRKTGCRKFACDTIFSHSHTNYSQLLTPRHKITADFVCRDDTWPLMGGVSNRVWGKFRDDNNKARKKISIKAKIRLFKKVDTSFVCLFDFLTSSSATRIYPGRVPRLTSGNFTCCHTRDIAGRPWLLSQPVTWGR